MSIEQIDNLIKDAGCLRESLKSGMINTVKLDNFLGRVIKLKDPVIRKRITRERFNSQLANFKESVN